MVTTQEVGAFEVDRGKQPGGLQVGLEFKGATNGLNGWRVGERAQDCEAQAANRPRISVARSHRFESCTAHPDPFVHAERV